MPEKPSAFTAYGNEETRKELAAIIPSEIARRYHLIPLELKGRVLTLGLEDPDAVKVLDMLRFRTGFEIHPVKKEHKEIEDFLDLYYPRERTILEELSEELKKEGEGVIRLHEGSFGPLTHDLREVSSVAPVVRWVNLILEEGLRVHASDIHFESCERHFRVRLRRDGVLYELERLPKKLSEPVILRLKVMSNMNTAESRLPQDGRINVKEAGRSVDLRVSSLPTLYGESLVVRILDREATSLKLEDLGFESEYIQTLRELFQKPHGMILVTGPTGSGKTTTLYSCLREIDSKKLKVITVEDPVEYELPALVQIPVHDSIGLSFARILRSILRHDPDVVMIGEIRDEETAKIALQASLTGHLVISTLHTNDAPGAITRLMEMGLEPFLIAASLKAVLAQRLMRKLCVHCRTELPESSPARAALPEIFQKAKIYEAKGCPVCQGFGYLGRVAVGELFMVDSEMRPLIAEGADLERLRTQARSKGMRTLLEQAQARVLAGVTSLDEYLKFRTDIGKRKRILS